MTDNNTTTALPAQDKAGTMYGETSWPSQHLPIPVQSGGPPQGRIVPSMSTTWYDPFRQGPPFQALNHSAVAAAGSLQKLSVGYAHGGALGGALLGSIYSLSNSVASPPNPSPLNQEENEDKSAGKRIRIACDSCRKKKTKCDGQSPCSNCKALNKAGECNYTDRPVKRKTKAPKLNGVKRQDLRDTGANANAAESIDSRLSNLENVLLQLTQKLDVLNNLPTLAAKTRTKKKNNEKEDELTQQEDDDASLSDCSDGNSDDSTASYTKSKAEGKEEDLVGSEDFKNNFHTILTNYPNRDFHAAVTTCGSQSRNRNGKEKEHYFGAHCLMSVFSDTSLDEIDKIIGPTDEHITLPIRNLPLVFLSQCKSFLLKWIDPPVIDHRKRRELFTRPFPSDSQLVYDLIDHCYMESAITSVVFTPTIRGLFEDYYKNPELDPSERRQFKLSDFLIMTSSLLMSIASKIDKDTATANSLEASSTLYSVSSNSIPNSAPNSVPKTAATDGSANTSASPDTPLLLQKISNEGLIKMKNNLFDNAIFYYHRLSVISDGMETIKAILHLMVYIESNWFTSHVNYILGAVVVRFAQDIGLHKIETFEGLSLKDKTERLQVWWLISFFDMDICFRTGKPPLINIADVTVNRDEDVKSYCQIFIPKHLPQPDRDVPVLDLLSTIEVQHAQYYRIYQAMLTKIRTKSYNQLFVSISKDLSFEVLSARLDILNSDMAALANTLPEYDRPRFFNDPAFHFIEYPDNLVQRDTVLMVHFTYLVHVMLINRLPFILVKAGAKINEEKAMRYKNISLDAARTVLVLVQQLKKDNTGLSFYNWLMFFPLSAFLAISTAVLDHPDVPETESDLRLLIHTSMHFFGAPARWREDQLDLTIFLQIDTLLGVLVKVMLRAVVKFYEVKFKTSIVDWYPDLREHLDSAKKEFPLIFEEHGEFRLKMLLVLASRVKTFSKRSSKQTEENDAESPSDGQTIMRRIAEALTDIEKGLQRKPESPSYDPINQEQLMLGMMKKHQQLRKKELERLQPNLTQLQETPQESPQQAFMDSAIPQYVPPFTDPYNENQMQPGTPAGFDPSMKSTAELFNDFVNEDDISLMFYSQMVNMPSFFYESNL